MNLSSSNNNKNKKRNSKNNQQIIIIILRFLNNSNCQHKVNFSKLVIRKTNHQSNFKKQNKKLIKFSNLLLQTKNKNKSLFQMLPIHKVTVNINKLKVKWVQQSNYNWKMNFKISKLLKIINNKNCSYNNSKLWIMI